MLIKDIQARDDLILVTDTQDTEPIRESFRVDYDSFFVQLCDGDYGEVFGFYGVVPELSKNLYFIKLA